MASLVKNGFKLLKRASEDTSATNLRPAKLTKAPKAAEIFIETGPKPTLAPKRLPVNAPVDVCIYRVTEQASDLWEMLQGRDDSLFQIQMRHEQQRAITFDLRNNFNDFLRAAHKQNTSMPSNLAELERSCGIRLIVTDGADPDDVGFIQWRVAFYCIDLRNIFFLLDGFFRYKEKQTTQPFQVIIHPFLGIDISLADLEYQHYVLKEQTSLLPLHIFEAHPVARKRITSLNIQIESASVFNAIITGDTWPYRKRLDSIGVGGGYHTQEDESKENRKYYRVWKHINVNDQNDTDKFMSMLCEDVFKKLSMRVTLDAIPEPDSDVQKYIDVLRSQPFLFFATTQDVSKEDGMMTETSAPQEDDDEDEGDA